ncbi:MAG: hypothetical protein ACKOOF_14005 [Planctomycetaceae bacterium]
MSRAFRRRIAAATRLSAVIVTLLAYQAIGGGRSALAQNDWQFPDPYFGVPQPPNPAAPSIQRRYRTEIGPPAVRRQAESVRSPQRLRRHRPQRSR